jgi:DNA-binding NtrC family response regulator
MSNGWAIRRSVEQIEDSSGMAMEKLPRPAVLVVDDEALIRWSLSERLGEAGYLVRQAGSGAEARQALLDFAGDPVVVVLDLRLPDVPDLSLLKEIRLRRPDAPVIMMTAHGTGDDAREAARLGVFRLVFKPFDVNDMVNLVGSAWIAAD